MARDVCDMPYSLYLFEPHSLIILKLKHKYRQSMFTTKANQITAFEVIGCSLQKEREHSPTLWSKTMNCRRELTSEVFFRYVGRLQSQSYVVRQSQQTGQVHNSYASPPPPPGAPDFFSNR